MPMWSGQPPLRRRHVLPFCRYSFDAVIGADRYDHPRGSRDQLCYVDIVPVGAACSVLNTAVDSTTHVIFEDKCCKFPVKFGPTRWDWIAHDGGTFVGQQAVDGVQSDVWLALGQHANKNWLAQSVDPNYPQLPVSYWEYCSPEGTPMKKAWDFHLDTFDNRPQDPSLFVVPEGCDQMCVWPKPTAGPSPTSVASAASVSAPPVPNWGGNATHFAFSVNATFTDTADAPKHPVWNFSYYYDWNLKAERYDHRQGQHIDVCKTVNVVDEPCSVLSASDGNLYIIAESLSNGCCHCGASRAPLTMLPDWISRNNGTYLGRSTQAGQDADGWVAYGKAANKYWTTTDSEQRFLKFSDNKYNREKQWDIREYSGEKPPAGLFSAPVNCETRCPHSSVGCQ